MRKLEQSEKGMSFRIYPELKREIDDYCDREQRRRRREGEHVEPGELRGFVHMVNRVLCWWMTLSHDDRILIDREGATLLDRLHDRPVDYEGPLDFEVKAGSVFRGKR